MKRCPKHPNTVLLTARAFSKNGRELWYACCNVCQKSTRIKASEVDDYLPKLEDMITEKQARRLAKALKQVRLT